MLKIAILSLGVPPYFQEFLAQVFQVLEVNWVILILTHSIINAHCLIERAGSYELIERVKIFGKLAGSDLTAQPENVVIQDTFFSQSYSFLIMLLLNSRPSQPVISHQDESTFPD